MKEVIVKNDDVIVLQFPENASDKEVSIYYSNLSKVTSHMGVGLISLPSNYNLTLLKK